MRGRSTTYGVYARIMRASGKGLLQAREKQAIIIDILSEFLDWLTDRKGYKKRALDGLKITFIIISSVVIILGLLFIFSVIFLMKGT
jgi:hypothetical protein